MANNCILGIMVTTFTEADGEKLHNILTGAKILADKRHEGIFIGYKSRYIFDAEFFRDRNKVQIFG